jgi:hypothetical protein
MSDESIAGKALGALSWLIHLNRGIGKDGTPPSASEWDAAWAEAESLVFDPDVHTPVDAPDGSYPGRVSKAGGGR